MNVEKIFYKGKQVPSRSRYHARLKELSVETLHFFTPLHEWVKIMYRFNNTVDLTKCNRKSLIWLALENKKFLASSKGNLRERLRKTIIANKGRFNHVMFLELLKKPKPNVYSVYDMMLKHCESHSEAVARVAKLKSSTSGTLVNFIKRHGKELGKQKFAEFSSKSAHTEASYIAKFGKSGKQKYQEYLNTKDSNSLSYFIKKYGDSEDKQRYELNAQVKRYEQPLDYFIDKHGPEEGYKLYKEHSMSKGKSGEYFVEKYGQDYWDELYKNKLQQIGFPVDFKKLDGFNAYRKRVHNLTKQNREVYNLPNAHKKGVVTAKGAYNLDHKYSIYQGYIDNVPEEVLSHICNLEFIPARDNISKGIKCSITLTELYKGYNNENNKNSQ